MADESPKVNCADCGLLAMRVQALWGIVETPEHVRETGAHQKNPHDRTYAESFPFCSALAHNLRIEIGDKHAHDHVRHVIHSPRECKAFVRWRPGFSPKEHQELADRETDRRWQEDQADKDHAWRTAEAKRATFWQIVTLVIAIVGIVVAFIGGIVAAKVGRGDL